MEIFENVMKEIVANRNHSWIAELMIRNKNRKNSTALLYRGKKISYGELFSNVYLYAKALKAVGIKKGQEIPMCVDNTPEFVYLVAAINMIGARANIFGSEFDCDYINEILNDTDGDYLFVSDKEFHSIYDNLKNTNKTIVPIPIDYSLQSNPYEDLTKHFFSLDLYQYEKEKKSLSNLMELDDFLEKSNNYLDDIVDEGTLEDIFTVTYSSGSTNSSRPKAIIHANKSYIVMGRYHDSSVSGIPSMVGKTVLAHIPTHSNTNLMSSISDTLMQGGVVALEPIYDKDYYIYSLIINKPNLAVATRSFWLNTMKKTMSDYSLKNVKLPFLYVPTAVGEPLAANEEKALNRWLRKMRAGISFIPSPSSFITMSVAGGDCEHGGIFLVLFRALQSKKLNHLTNPDPHGMGAYSMVDIAVLDNQGNHCKPGDYGLLVATSPCDMVGYKNNPIETEKFFVEDNNGKKYGNLNCYGYLDKQNNVYMKGRVSDNNLPLQPFQIADVILKDTKRILSCEVIPLDVDGEIVFVAHVEPQINAKADIREMLLGAEIRCRKAFGDEICKRLFFRLRSNLEAFPLTGCGKRNLLALKAEGFDEKCIIPSQFYNKKKNKELTL